MINAADKTVIVSIAEKLDSLQKMKICNLSAIDYLVTNIDPASPEIEKYAGVTTVI